MTKCTAISSNFLISTLKSFLLIIITSQCFKKKCFFVNYNNFSVVENELVLFFNDK